MILLFIIPYIYLKYQYRYYCNKYFSLVNARVPYTGIKWMNKKNQIMDLCNLYEIDDLKIYDGLIVYIKHTPIKNTSIYKETIVFSTSICHCCSFIGSKTNIQK